jgi:hypothetical protein
MSNFAVTTPVVNGNHYSFASVELDVGGLVFADVTARYPGREMRDFIASPRLSS